MALITSTKLGEENSQKLETLINEIPNILSKLKNPGYDEIFGYRINVIGTEFVDETIRNEILYKFLAAEEFNVDKTVERLVKTLDWRNEFRPLSAAYKEKFDTDLEDLGVITKFEGEDVKTNLSVTTWNLYGKLKNPKKIFEQYGKDLKQDDNLPGSPFLRWRVGIMERSLLNVDFTSEDNNKIAQVHDYKGVSMFRMDPGMKASTKEIISIFGDHYPELLSVKFFLNTPTLMSWMFTALKLLGIVSAETAKKFQVINSGDVSDWFPKSAIPVAYGGSSSKSLSELQDLYNFEAPSYGASIIEGDAQIEANNLTIE